MDKAINAYLPELDLKNPILCKAFIREANVIIYWKRHNVVFSGRYGLI